MAATYCLEKDIATKLNYKTGDARLVFSSSTFPTLEEVTELIEQAETDIESKTNNSWKSKTKPDEYHDFDGCRYSGYSKGYRSVYVFTLDEGAPIIAISKFEVLVNGTFVDYIATKTEGNGVFDEDYWIDKAAKKVYLHTNFPTIGYRQVRFTYTYGNTVVPKDIKKATILMVSIEVSEMRGDNVMRTEGENNFEFSNLMRSWKKQIKNIIDEHNQQEFLAFY